MTRTRMMSIAAVSLAGLMLLLPGLRALAADSNDEDRLYQVELIIFENKAVTSSTEILPSDPGKVDVTNAIELTAPSSEKTRPDLTQPPPLPAGLAGTDAMPAYRTFELLPDDELKLSDSVDRLEASADYQPLIHIGWRQPVPEQDNAKPVLIDSRKLLLNTASIGDTGAAEPAKTQQTDNPPDSLYDQGPDEIITRINENFVSGKLTLIRGRYLHLSLDLIYQRQSNAPQLFSFFGFSNGTNTTEQFRLTESRRMKRGEIHYFDHPKFGVIAMITAVAENDEEQVQTIPLNRQR